MGNGGIEYRPFIHAIGTDSFTYHYASAGGAVTAEVNVNILNTVNNLPVPGIFAVNHVAPGSSTTYNVVDQAMDLDRNELVCLSNYSQPTDGSVHEGAPGVLVFTASLGARYGSTSFTYWLCNCNADTRTCNTNSPKVEGKITVLVDDEPLDQTPLVRSTLLVTAGPPKTEVLCDNAPDNTLSCSANQVINILKVTYGRGLDPTADQQCASKYKWPAYSGTCGSASLSPDTYTAFISTICSGFSSCNLNAYGAALPMGDPCKNVYKVATVKYECLNLPTAVNTAYACDGSTTKATCPAGTTINVIKANFGLGGSDSPKCASAGIFGNAFSGTFAFQERTPYMSSLCDDKITCNVGPLPIWGDPAPNIIKFLKMSYICAAASSSPPSDSQQSIRFCEDDPMTIACPAGRVISVLTGTYARLTDTGCPNAPAYTGPTCSVDATTELSDECGGKSSCTIDPEVNLKVRGLPDPCPKTAKYIDMVYVCTDGVKSLGPICDGTSDKLSCPDGKSIQVVSAFYGTDPDTAGCGAQPIGCGGPVTGMLSTACNGKSTCAVPPYAVPDPCANVRKHWDVRYTCVDGNGPFTVTWCDGGAPPDLDACPAGTALYVTDAFYGRDNMATCAASGEPLGTPTCTGFGDFSGVINAACANRQKCTKDVVNAAFAGLGRPDPCGGFFKFGRINYRCYPSGVAPGSNSSAATPPSGVSCGSDTPTKLTCSDGKTISIRSATYGRATSTACPCTTTTCGNVPCGTGDAFKAAVTTAVGGKCNGLFSCDISTADVKQVSGSDCTGSASFLSIDYDCVENLGDNRVAVACVDAGDKQLIMDCPFLGTVQVVDAVYGRTESSVCPGAGSSNTQCSSASNLVASVMNLCSDTSRSGNVARTTCKLDAAAIGQLPLPPACAGGTSKYLKVTYKCVSPAGNGWDPKDMQTPVKVLQEEVGGRSRLTIMGVEVILTQDINRVADSNPILAVLPDSMDVAVYADTLEVDGPLVLPGRNILLFARKLVCRIRPSNCQLQIDTSGADGTNYKEVGIAPVPEDTLTGAACPFTGWSGSYDDQLLASQCYGKTGVSGADGGTGGAAGSITMAIGDALEWLNTTGASTTTCLVNTRAQGGDGGVGQVGGKGGRGGAAATPPCVDGQIYAGNTVNYNPETNLALLARECGGARCGYLKQSDKYNPPPHGLTQCDQWTANSANKVARYLGYTNYFGDNTGADSVRYFAGCPPGKAGNGGAGGAWGRNGGSGDGGQVTFLSTRLLNPVSSSNTAQDVKACAAVNPGVLDLYMKAPYSSIEPARGGLPGYPVAGQWGHWRAYDRDYDSCDTTSSLRTSWYGMFNGGMRPVPAGPAGVQGRSGGPRPGSGTAGKQGTFASTINSRPQAVNGSLPPDAAGGFSYLIKESDAAAYRDLADTRQLFTLMTRGKTAYLSGNMSLAYAQLSWVAAVAPCDNGTEPGDDDRVVGACDLKNEARYMLLMMDGSGRNGRGDFANKVPVQSLSLLQAHACTFLLPSLKDLEAQVVAYQEARTNAAKKKEAFDTAKAKYQAYLAQLDKDIATKTDDFNENYLSSQGLEETRDKAWFALDAAAAAFDEAIREQKQEEWLWKTIKDVAVAVTMVASLAEPALSQLQLGVSAAVSNLKDPKDFDPLGTSFIPVDNSNLMGWTTVTNDAQAKELSNTLPQAAKPNTRGLPVANRLAGIVKTASDSGVAVRNIIDGVKSVVDDFKQKPSDAQKVAVLTPAWEETIKPYLNLPVAGPYKSALLFFKDAANAFNVKALQILSRYQELVHLKLEQINTQNALAAITQDLVLSRDPGFVKTGNAIVSLHRKLQGDMLDAMHDMHMALSYLLLDKAQQWQAPIALDYVSLKNTYTEFVRGIWDNLLAASALPTDATVNYLPITLSQIPDLTARITAGDPIQFSLLPVSDVPFGMDSLSRNAARVYARNVQVYLNGARKRALGPCPVNNPGCDIVKVKLTHTGVFSIRDKCNRIYNMQHEPLPAITFAYKLEDDGSVSRNCDQCVEAKLYENSLNLGTRCGDVVFSDTNADNLVVPISPAATWRLIYDPTVNPNIDVSGVTELDLRFAATIVTLDLERCPAAPPVTPDTCMLPPGAVVNTAKPTADCNTAPLGWRLPAQKDNCTCYYTPRSRQGCDIPCYDPSKFECYVEGGSGNQNIRPCGGTTGVPCATGCLLSGPAWDTWKLPKK